MVVVKKAAPSFDGESFNLRTLNELELRKRYQIEITNNFTALENLRDDEDRNKAAMALKRISKPKLKRESAGIEAA
jgi:ABC-type arginine transport system ATPase subunit